MDLSEMFKYEEQENRKYLVYEKRESDVLDTFTLEMMSNNRIEGLAAFSCMQMDHSVRMKYNVTGLKSLEELFSDTINRQKFLAVLESLADTVIRSEDYMLDLSSYVFDEAFIYVDPEHMKVFMIVLPVKREGEQTEVFLKKMLFDVRYDQTEDCSYVASLMNFLGSGSGFSMRSFKEQVATYRKEKTASFGRRMQDTSAVAVTEHPNFIKQPEINIPPIPPRSYSQNVSGIDERHNSVRYEESPAKEHASHTREKEENLQILFSDSPEEPKKKKKGFFAKKDKGEKREKKVFFWNKEEKKGENDSFSDISERSPLEGLAIPGMDFLGKLQEHGKNKDLDGQISAQRQEIPIPVQRVDVSRKEVDQQDFGETVYVDEESEAPTVFEEEEKSLRQKFILYRCSTQETFEIKGDVVRVGRSPSISEICISGNRGVGRVHAVLYVRNGQVYIADNNSKNKTFVDGEELKPGDSPKMLLSGSKIKLGTEELEFRISR